MGLPSGLLWATRNVGANSPTGYGDYYSWGNVDGHAAGSGYDFSQEVYEQTPGAQLQTDLDAAHDAAAVAWGDGWRMPNFNEMAELKSNCVFSPVTIGGVEVIKATSNLNGESVLFPCAGFFGGLSHRRAGVSAFIWCSHFDSRGYVSRLWLEGDTANLALVGSRYDGFSIRAVRDP